MDSEGTLGCKSASSKDDSDLEKNKGQSDTLTTEPFKFNFQIGKKSKLISEDEKAKLFEIVKGLGKYTEYEEDQSEMLKVPSKQKTYSLNKAKLNKESSSLSELIDSELAVLHQDDSTSPGRKKQNGRKPKKGSVNISSVSQDKQLEFESLLKEDESLPKEDLISATVGIEKIQISAGARPSVEEIQISAGARPGVEDKQITAGARPKVKAETKSEVLELAEGKQQKKKVKPVKDSQKQVKPVEESQKKVKPVEESPKKKGENKKTQQRRKGQGTHCDDKVENQELGSYSQLLLSMGRRSPQRKIQQIDETKNKNGPAQECNEPKGQHVEDITEKSQGKEKKKRNKKQERKQQSEQPQVTEYQRNIADTSYTEVLVRVAKSEHVYILGPQGRHLQEIMMATGVMVSVPPLNSASEEIVLRGDKMQLGPAIALMFSKSQLAATTSPVQGQGQGPSMEKKTGGKNISPQMQGKGSGNKKSNDNVYHSHNQTTRVQKRHHEKQGTVHTDQPSFQEQITATPPHQGYHEHVVSTPVHHGHRQVKSKHIHQHLYKQEHGKHVQDQSVQQQQHQIQGQGNVTKSQGKRQRKKKTLFAEYMPMAEVSQGLKRGTLVEGPLRINPKNFEEGYVPHPDGKSDILVCGMKSRNRALNGDIVAVEVMDEGDWKLNTQDLEDLEKSMTSYGDELEGSLQNSDPEVVIESEEIIEISATKERSQTENSPGLKKGETKSAVKKFTSLSDIMVSPGPAHQTEEGRDKIKKMLQRTGKVVAIIEKKHLRACVGFIKPMPGKNNEKHLFCPSDHRVPRIMVPTDNCPKDFLERPDDYANTLYVCRITDWKIDSFYAEGCLAKSLGEAGAIDPETEGMLLENGVDFDEFTQEALDCLPKQSPWKIPEEEFSYRKDFRSKCVFTIDPATARDLDDAVSCEDLGGGKYKVGVHIADVSFFLKENSELDKVAALRSTSVYLVHKVIPMLPRLLCEELCSLNPDVDRLTFSVEWVISEEGEIEEEWFGRSVIRSCAKLSYDHAQGFIEEPDRIWTQEELPSISENFTVDDIKTRVLNLQKIAVNLRKSRMDSGALRLDQVKLQYSLDAESGLPNGYWVYQQRDSNRLIEEFMLLANMAVAHRINSIFPDRAVLRRHPPPQEKMIDNLKEQCSALGIHIDVTSAGALQRSLASYSGSDDESMARMQVLVALCSKPMQNAKYFCTGCLDDESMYHHYALNVPLYTHFTSPIRRYPDVMVHRLLGASLGYCEEPKKNPTEIQKLADHANDKKTAAKKVGDLSSELFFAVFVKTAGPLEERAMVMGVLDKAFDIFVLKLGVSKRVYCDKLPIKEKIFKRERKVPSLVLVWNGEGDEAEVRQEITIFSIVDCILEQGEQPLQWTAVIKKPTFSPAIPFIH